MSLQSATYYIKRAEQTVDIPEGQLYAALAQAEMLIAIEYALQSLVKAVNNKTGKL
jgi:hypothetical protein